MALLIKKYWVLLFFLFWSSLSFSQKEYNNWMFGKEGLVSFNANPPASSFHRPLNSGCGIDSISFWATKYYNLSTISDEKGQLLFTVGPCTVWDKLQRVMPNGDDLLGMPYGAKSQIVIKKPDSKSLYYLFYVDSIDNILNYALLDMNLNGGFGDIIYKNRALSTQKVTSQITATKNSSGCANWLIAHLQDTGAYLAYRITSSGIDSTPILSHSGRAPVFPKKVDKTYSNATGFFYFANKENAIVVSPNSKKIAFTDSLLIEVSDFDATNGIVSNSKNILDFDTIPLAQFSFRFMNGISFSPNSKLLYLLVDHPADLFQFDITKPTLKEISASAYKTVIFSRPSFLLSDIQLAPNGKLYFSHILDINAQPTITNRKLGVVNNPNGKDVASIDVVEYSNLTADNIFLASNGGYYDYAYSTPNIITSPIPFVNGFSLGDDITKCFDKNVLLTPTYRYGANTKYLWNTGDTTFSITAQKEGKYWVKATHDCGVSSDTIEIINVYDTIPLNLGKDTVSCEKQLSLKTFNAKGVNYLWSNASIYTSITVNTSGDYWLQTTSVCGIKRDTVKVSFEKDSVPKTLLGKDTILCASQFDITTTNLSLKNLKYLWNTGDTTANILALKSGKYWVEISNLCNSQSDTIEVNIDYDGITNFSIGNDTAVCSSYKLNALVIPKTNYLWSNGDTATTILVTNPGKYWVRATTPCSIRTDTAEIYFITDTLQSIHLGRDTTVCDTIFTISSGTKQNAHYVWNTGDTSTFIRVKNTGYYWLDIANKCYNRTDTVFIRLVQDSITGFNLGNDTLLCDNEFDLKMPLINGARYKWSTGDTIPSITIKQSGTYAADLTTPICNNTYTNSIKVELFTSHPLKLNIDTTLCEKDFEGITIIAPKGYNHYLWGTGETSQKYEVKDGGHYVLSTIDTCGNSYTDAVNIEICDCILYVPNTFSPNYDGLNDGFKPVSFCPLIKYNLKIYNRWGQIIFETTNPNLAWDGKYNNEYVPEGVYLINVRYGFRNAPRNSDFFGQLSVIR